MAQRKRKYPGIRGRRPDKKYARGVRAKILMSYEPKALPNRITHPGDDTDVWLARLLNC